LGWVGTQAEQFIESVRAECGRSAAGRQNAKQNLKILSKNSKTDQVDRVLTVEMFAMISNPIHHLVYTLAGCEHFRSDTKWIAKELNVSEFEIQDAVERLVVLGLLKRKGKKILTDQEVVFSPKSTPSDLLIKFHETVLSWVNRAVHEVPFYERDLGVMFLAIRPQDYSKFCARVADFRKSMVKEFGEGPGRDHLISLSTQVVPYRNQKKSIKLGSKL